MYNSYFTCRNDSLLAAEGAMNRCTSWQPLQERLRRTWPSFPACSFPWTARLSISFYCIQFVSGSLSTITPLWWWLNFSSSRSIILSPVFLISWVVFLENKKKKIPRVPKKCLNGNTNCNISFRTQSPDPDSFRVFTESAGYQMFASANALQPETCRKTPVVNQGVFITCCSEEEHIPWAATGCLCRKVFRKNLL